MTRSAGERVPRYLGRLVGVIIIYYQFKEGWKGRCHTGAVEKAGLGPQRKVRGGVHGGQGFHPKVIECKC
jgi:hypothetical protein